MNNSTARIIVSAIVAAFLAGAAPAALADVRAQSRSSVNKSSNTNVNRNKNVNVNSNKNVNVNTNKNVNVDVDVDVDRHGGCCYHDHDFHPVAAVATAIVIGSIVSSLPSGCQTVIVNGFAYQQCGGYWYQPQMTGSTTTYIVVNPPR